MKKLRQEFSFANSDSNNVNTPSLVVQLIQSLASESPALRDKVAFTAGVSVERVTRATCDDVSFTLGEQIRLAEATMACARRHALLAMRLRTKCLALSGNQAPRYVLPRTPAPVPNESSEPWRN